MSQKETEATLNVQSPQKVDLPTKPVEAERINPKLLVLYGSPKVGKTTLLAALENTLIIDLENGTDFLRALKKKASSLKEVVAIGRAIKEAGSPYRRLAIDTITKFEEYAEVEALKMYKATPIGSTYEGKNVLELPSGAGYYWLRVAFQKYKEFLLTLSQETILVAHLKEKIVDKKGKEVNSKDIDLTGKIRNLTCQDADAVGYVYRNGKSIWISFKSSEEVTCGSRCAHLKGQDIEVAECDDLGTIVKSYWDRIYLPAKA